MFRRNSFPKHHWQALRRAFRKSSTAFQDEWKIRYELAASLKFKNVALYLPEWIEFHLMVGVEHFFLYDNNSTDHPREILEPYLRAGIVTLHDWPEIPAHPRATEHCIREHGAHCRWIAFLDDDEFLFPAKGGNLASTLRRFEAYPAVAVHWVMFGSNGHHHRPDGLVISNYQQCEGSPQNTFKSIINPRKFRAAKSTHYSLYKDHMRCVNEKYEPIRNSHGVPTPTVDLLRINHYWSKSYEDGLIKVNRGKVDNWPVERDMDYWKKYDDTFNQVEDTLILRYEAELKERLARRGFQKLILNGSRPVPRPGPLGALGR